MSAVFDPDDGVAGGVNANGVESQVRGLAMKVIADVGASPTPMNILNRFLGGVFSLAPKNPDEKLQNIFVNAVLKAYDELIMPLDIEKIPNFIEVVLKRAARTVLKETLEGFFADEQHVAVAGNGVLRGAKSGAASGGGLLGGSPAGDGGAAGVAPSSPFPPPPGFGG